jgi:hypothetical protein
MNDDDVVNQQGLLWLRGYDALVQLSPLMFWWPLIYACGTITDLQEKLAATRRPTFDGQPSAIVIDLAEWRERRAAGGRRACRGR